MTPISWIFQSYTDKQLINIEKDDEKKIQTKTIKQTSDSQEALNRNPFECLGIFMNLWMCE